MSRADDEPTAYLIARVRDALAHDEHVAALDVSVRIVGSDVFLTGGVPTSERRDACGHLVQTMLPEHALHNQLLVLAPQTPAAPEDVA